MSLEPLTQEILRASHGFLLISRWLCRSLATPRQKQELMINHNRFHAPQKMQKKKKGLIEAEKTLLRDDVGE